MEEIIIKTQEDMDNMKDGDYKYIIESGKFERYTHSFSNAVVIISGNAIINYMYANATINYMRGNASITDMCGNATIIDMRGNASINYMYANASITDMYANASITYMYANASITDMCGNAIITYMHANASITNMYANASISDMRGNASITSMSGNASINDMRGNASIKSGRKYCFIRGYSKKNIKNFNGIFMKLPKTKTKQWFLDNYPIEQKGKGIILYKAVHKINDEYVSDYNQNFKYEIGKTYKHKNVSKQKGCCAEGLHLSHKYWAVKYGIYWNDYALLKCSTPLSKIVVCDDCDGKIRTSELTVLKEVKKRV
jgi:hypothetical protein